MHKQFTKRKVSNLYHTVKRRLPEYPQRGEFDAWFWDQLFVCPYCDIALKENNVSIDHKKPISRDGANVLDNLQVCCQNCNRAKGSLEDWEFRMLMHCLSHLSKHGSKDVYVRLRLGTVRK